MRKGERAQASHRRLERWLPVKRAVGNAWAFRHPPMQQERGRFLFASRAFMRAEQQKKKGQVTPANRLSFLGGRAREWRESSVAWHSVVVARLNNASWPQS